MMNEHDAVEILKSAEQLDIEVWLDGGWGVDALLGKQTRPHNDIDIFIEKRNAADYTNWLTANGYSEVLMDYATESHSVWRDADDRIIDLHLFEFGEAGIISFEGEAYPSEVIDGKGIIGGLAVRCLTAEAQVMFHQGYELTDKDFHDVRLLCETFGIDEKEK